MFNKKLGLQGVWGITTNENGTFNISREDGRFFEIGMITKGYDRPILVNYGVAITSPVFVGDKVAVEPETIVSSLDGESSISQNRVLRASADNPNYSGIPAGFKTGENYLDGQRIIYRDGAVKSIISTAEEAPKRKTKDGFVNCELVSLKEIGKTVDAPGKAAIFDAISKYLTDTELAGIVGIISERVLIDQMQGAYKSGQEQI